MQKTPKEIDIDGLVNQLFERVDDSLDESDDSPSAMEAILINQASLIQEIARACERTELYNKSLERTAAFKGELEAKSSPDKRLITAWGWLLNRITQAPTSIHRRGSIRLGMPLVAAYLPANTGLDHVAQ
ncbi:MAG: hypothetical protein CMK74_03810 [Pseudomonadales bacterium]|nr:hypothetical protein [Pseudomonadales bacterium]|tara:strand:- start:104 stop:493 length:390 start_codon:yes stop_codon:yes gene_type:complete